MTGPRSILHPESTIPRPEQGNRAARRRAAREAAAVDLTPPNIPERLLGALGAFAGALDDAHAQGLQIPDLAATGINNLAIVAKIIEGQLAAGPADLDDFETRMAAVGLVPARPRITTP